MEGNKIHLTGSKGDTKDVDIEKQDSVKKQLDIINNEEDEPLEKAKEKPPRKYLALVFKLFKSG